MLRLGFSFTLLIAISIILGACSVASPVAEQAPQPVTFTIEMTEYAFTPDTLEVRVGQEVTLELINQGLISHELMLGREVAHMNNRPDGYTHDFFETSHVEPMVMGGVMESDQAAGGHGADHSGFMLVLPETGDKATLSFTVSEAMVGEWEMGCFEQDGVHYDAGMKGILVVLP